jgi:hypothetical protein
LKNDPGALVVAKLIARGAFNYVYSAPSARDSIGKSFANAAVAVVPLLEASGHDAVHDFHARIDAEIIRPELEAQLSEREIVPSEAIVQIVARPANAKGTLGCIVARLANDSFGLFVKLKSRWGWHEGDRASVFATVPNEYMERVVGSFGG